MSTKIKEKPDVSGCVFSLNPEQSDAVCHTGGHLLVFAGAGSGKTRVLTSRIAFLIKQLGVNPREILAVTFTNKAAREMKERVESLMPEKISGIWMGTFHSICSRILRAEMDKLDFGYKKDFVIYDARDQKNIIKQRLAELKAETDAVSPELIRALIDGFKMKGEFPPDASSFSRADRNAAIKMEIINSYDMELKKCNALDFNDLLMLAVRLFESEPEILKKYRNRFRHILVDEYQDTNHVQYRIVKMLGENNASVCAVGDDGQSIYSWRGAELKNILGFSKDFPGAKVVRLNRNYRSTQTIVEASNALINNNSVGEKKNMWTGGEKGNPIGVYEARNEFDEADFIVGKIKSFVDAGDFFPNDFAVLYRTNSKSRLLEERFFKEPGISCVVVGALSFYARAEIRDVVSYMRVLVNASDNESVRRIINTPARGIGKSTLEKLSEFASLKDLSLLEAARIAGREGFPSVKAAGALFQFSEMMEKISSFSEGKGAFETINYILRKTGYEDFLEKDDERKENIAELANSAFQFDRTQTESGPDFREFVEHISLASDSDTETGESSVKLMTLHASKGLEFPVVFIAGMNDGLIPLIRNPEKDDIEEERRLCYVGMTRAMKRLFMCYPIQRKLYGKTEMMNSSPFFDEIPEHFKRYEDFEPDFYSGTSAPSESAPVSLHSLPDEKPDEGISSGTFVLHKKFGRGKAVKVEGTGAKAAVTVVFPAAGKKRILASFLKIL